MYIIFVWLVMGTSWERSKCISSSPVPCTWTIYHTHPRARPNDQTCTPRYIIITCVVVPHSVTHIGPWILAPNHAQCELLGLWNSVNIIINYFFVIRRYFCTCNAQIIEISEFWEIVKTDWIIANKQVMTPWGNKNVEKKLLKLRKMRIHRHKNTFKSVGK